MGEDSKGVFTIIKVKRFRSKRREIPDPEGNHTAAGQSGQPRGPLHHGPNSGGVNSNYGQQYFHDSTVHVGTGVPDSIIPIAALSQEKPDPWSDKHSISDPSGGTCQWFLNSEEYQAWDSSPSSKLIFVIGNPGVGKTVLAKFLIDRLKDSEKNVVFFFCKEQDKDHSSYVSILRSLVHQYMRRARLPSGNRAWTSWQKHMQRRFPGDSHVFNGPLCEVFDVILTDADLESGDWYCVLDGVDALDHSNEPGKDRNHLFKRLAEILSGRRTADSKKRPLNLRVLVTSRPFEGMYTRLSSLKNTDIIHFTDEKGTPINKVDIKEYIEDELAQFASEGDSERRRREIIKDLKSRHKGVFRWAASVVSILQKRGFHGLDSLDDAVRPSLTDIEEKMFKDIRCVEVHPLLLTWVTLAFRDLSMKELDFAFNASNSSFSHLEPLPSNHETYVSSIPSYGGLLKLQENRVVLFHESAKPYLEREHFKYQLGVSHAKMAKTCIYYLTGKGLEREPLKWNRKRDCENEYNALCSRFPFLEYAASSWYKHVQNAYFSEVELAEIWHLIRTNLADKPIMQLLFQVDEFSNHRRYESGQMFLHILVHYDLPVFAKRFLGIEGTDPNVVDGDGRTPLWLAAKMNSEKMIHLLLKTKRIDPNYRRKNGQSPLSIALEEGQIEAVKILLEDPRVNQTLQDGDGRTPLLLAAGEGYGTVVEALLKDKNVRTLIDCPDASMSKQTPLLWAARKGSAMVVELLLKGGANPNSTDAELSRTSLIWAAANEHEEVVTKLLQRKDLNLFLRDDGDYSAFEWAASRKNNTIANEILNEARKRPGSWPINSIEEFLKPAVTLNKEESLEVLLAQCDINFCPPGLYLLSLAATRGHGTIVGKLLKSRKVDINAIDANHETALHCAARAGRQNVVEILLQDDRLILAATNRGPKPAWKLAEDGGYHEIVKLIREA